MKIISVVGARPNFIKIAPLVKEFKKYPMINHILIHTGQHYDFEMSKQFFNELEIPEPDINLEIGSGLHGEQTAKVIEKLEKILIHEKPDLVLVVGDVNSTMAASIAASKLNIKVAHVESGLRSYDKTMPEETNRKITDHISDILFTSFEDANKILESEGIKNGVYFVGNVMIDSLIQNLDRIDNSKILDELNLKKDDYLVMTLHRPSNVDTKEKLLHLLEIIDEIHTKIVFTLHPRTRNNLEKFGLIFRLENKENIILTKPLNYINFLALVKNSKAVLTDSGGIQEETTYLNIPCITLRENTERPGTIEYGTNVLTGIEKEKIFTFLNQINNRNFKKGTKLSKWDGKTSERIVKVLLNEFAK